MMTTSDAKTDNLRDVIDAALESGVPRDDLLDMVNIAYLQMAGGTITPQANGNGYKGLELATDDKELPIYTELPEGLIDLPSAQRDYGCKADTLRSWVRRGHLTLMGRLRGASPGGGYLVVSKCELERRLAMPPNRGGRPRKNRTVFG